MEGNIVKAAWILGGSMLASVVLAGVGLFVGVLILSNSAWKHLDVFSQRAADAVLEAPKNTTVHFDPTAMVKVGFEPKLPVAVRLENSMDEHRGTRAVFEVEVKPTLAK